MGKFKLVWSRARGDACLHATLVEFLPAHKPALHVFLARQYSQVVTRNVREPIVPDFKQAFLSEGTVEVCISRTRIAGGSHGSLSKGREFSGKSRSPRCGCTTIVSVCAR